LPIGLGLSLILKAAFLARHVDNEVGVLTLPDIFAKRCGKLTEVIIACACIASFVVLLAGNLVGMGNVLSCVWDVSSDGRIWTASAIIWAWWIIFGGL
jgi:SSS family solute:Na+ symporter